MPVVKTLAGGSAVQGCLWTEWEVSLSKLRETLSQNENKAGILLGMQAGFTKESTPTLDGLLTLRAG